jgi:hypothetical protein
MPAPYRIGPDGHSVDAHWFADEYERRYRAELVRPIFDEEGFDDWYARHTADCEALFADVVPEPWREEVMEVLRSRVGTRPEGKPHGTY